MIVVSDTTPLISLLKINRIDLLEKLFGEVFIPCGLSSALFGLIFGSVFGFEHALDPMITVVAVLLDGPIKLYRGAGKVIESN